jgi:hypothetical protein
MEELEFEYEAQRPGFIRRYAVDFLSSAMTAAVVIGFLLMGTMV